MGGLFSSLDVAGVIGLILGLLAVVLLCVIAARLSRVIDLLEEVGDMMTSGASQPQMEERQEEQI